MAGASLLALIDDIVTVLDDVAAMTKVAAGKTSGVLGDDLALNAEQVAGVRAARELPVVWAVAKGSFRNKLILLPMALLLSSFLPWAVMPLLMVGGLFLCFEGAEKILHHGDEADDQVAHEAAAMLASPDNEQALLELEKEKIQGAIRTDFVLSAEIMIITLGTVATAPFMTRLSVMSLIAVLMTVGVYGIVAAIVKLDDIGLYLQRQSGKQRDLRYFIGTALLKFAPLLMRFLVVAGTIAMFTVGGGILGHGIPPVHHLTESAAEWVTQFAHNPVFGMITGVLADALTGVVAGVFAVLLLNLFQRIKPGSH